MMIPIILGPFLEMVSAYDGDHIFLNGPDSLQRQVVSATILAAWKVADVLSVFRVSFGCFQK